MTLDMSYKKSVVKPVYRLYTEKLKIKILFCNLEKLQANNNLISFTKYNCANVSHLYYKDHIFRDQTKKDCKGEKVNNFSISHAFS